MEKADGCQGMPVGYCKHNYVVTPIAAAISDVVLSLGKINTVPDTWYAVIDLANAFYCIARSRKDQKPCRFFVRVNSAPLPRDFIISFDGSSILRL